MSRLIDADKLIERMKEDTSVAKIVLLQDTYVDKEVWYRVIQIIESYIDIINEQPTVIDMCKVIGYLEKLKNRAEKQESIERYIAYDRAIDIVRGRWD